MARTKGPGYVCTKCSKGHYKETGKCHGCGEFGTVEEAKTPEKTASRRAVGVKTSATSKTPAVKAIRPQEITEEPYQVRPTGIGELDRVLGGGFVPGGVILLAGEPGAGKSTLTTHVAEHASEAGFKTLICSSEESIGQISLRAKRLKVKGENLYLASTTDVAEVLGHIEEVQPDLIIIDSIQSMASSELDARSGSVSQVTEVSTILTHLAKDLSTPLILIGQVTKEGTIAGPKTVEHLVDVVIHFEGDKDSSLRLLRGIKNRYGPADEIGCFEHTETGIVEVPDPSGLLLGRREEPAMGVATGVILEGRRCLPIEVNALVIQTRLPVPRRAVSGLDPNRSVMTQAITERLGRVHMSEADVYLSTIGGIKAVEPSIDLAVALAMATSRKGWALPLDLVAIGELTLSGDVRAVPGLKRRLVEAQRLGFTQAIVPSSGSGPRIEVPGMRIIPVKNIKDAVREALTVGHRVVENEDD